MKKHGMAIYLSLVLTVFLLVSIAPMVQAQEKTITLNYSNNQGPAHKNSMITDEWAKEVEKRTNGGVKITVFHGGTLTPGTQAYDGVIHRVSDLAQCVFSYHRGRFPLTEFSDLPLGIKSTVTAANLFHEYYKKFDPAELKDVKVMFLHSNSPAILHMARKPIASLDELKGLKIRCTPNGTPIVKALGAAPVAMPMADTYDALSKNVVDGAFLPMEALEGWKIGEVVKYTTACNSIGYNSAWYVVMNKDAWNSIPEKWQKEIEAINAEWLPKVGKLWDDLDEEAKKFYLSKGGKIIELSEAESKRWREAVQPVLDDYVKKCAEKGLPGDQVLKFAQEYIAAHQK